MIKKSTSVVAKVIVLLSIAFSVNGASISMFYPHDIDGDPPLPPLFDPNANIAAKGSVSWNLTKEHSADTVTVALTHVDTASITHSDDCQVVKPDPPNGTGTWELDFTAVPSKKHQSMDRYMLEAEAFNATQGPYNPNVTTAQEIKIN